MLLQLCKLLFFVWKQQIINDYAYGFSWCNANSGIADDYVCGAVKRFGKKGGKVMLRDSQLWMKIGRICTLLAKRLDISPERAFDIFQMSKTNELLHDERSLLYLMSDLYIVDDVIMELQSADGLHKIYK